MKILSFNTKLNSHIFLDIYKLNPTKQQIILQNECDRQSPDTYLSFVFHPDILFDHLEFILFSLLFF